MAFSPLLSGDFIDSLPCIPALSLHSSVLLESKAEAEQTFNMSSQGSHSSFSCLSTFEQAVNSSLWQSSCPSASDPLNGPGCPSALSRVLTDSGDARTTQTLLQVRTPCHFSTVCLMSSGRFFSYCWEPSQTPFVALKGDLGVNKITVSLEVELRKKASGPGLWNPTDPYLSLSLSFL